MINATLEQMSRWASMGAILELNACDIDPVSSFADGDPGVVGAMLKTIPAERLVIDSDYGQNGNIEPVEGLIHFAQFLRDKFGVSESRSIRWALSHPVGFWAFMINQTIKG